MTLAGRIQKRRTPTRAEGPSRGAQSAPLGGSAAAQAQAWGDCLRAEGPSRGAQSTPLGGSAAAQPQAWGDFAWPR